MSGEKCNPLHPYTDSLLAAVPRLKIGQEHSTESVLEGTNIRTTTIYPGAIQTELLNTIAPSETKTMVEEFYKNVGLQPEVIANAVLYAISQPDQVDVSDLAVRPSRES